MVTSGGTQFASHKIKELIKVLPFVFYLPAFPQFLPLECLAKRTGMREKQLKLLHIFHHIHTSYVT